MTTFLPDFLVSSLRFFFEVGKPNVIGKEYCFKFAQRVLTIN